MAQLGIKLENNWFTQSASNRTRLQKIEKRSFEYVSGLCQYELGQWQLFVWGDCAMRNQDELIIDGILQQNPVSVFGRSWIAIHKEHGEVQGACDQLGIFPLLLLNQQQCWYICSDRNILLDLLGEIPQLNAHAMQHMLCFGQILDDSSIVENAIHLSSARYFSIIQATLTLRQLVRKTPLSDIHESNFEQATEAFVESVRQSLHFAVNPMLSLSGGLDSRLILAACMALNIKLPALCYGNSQSDDIKIAKQLSCIAKIPLFVGHDILDNDRWQNSKRISRVGLGEVPTHHAHALMDTDLLQQTRDSTLLTGTGAEAFRAFYYDRGMPGFEFFDQPFLQKHCLPRMKRYIREEFFRNAVPIFSILPQLEQSLMPVFEQKLIQQLTKHIDCTRAADQFYLDVRVSRMVVAGQQLLDPFYQRSHPFLAPSVLSTVGNLPATYKVGSRFHRKAIMRLAPKLADINWDKTGLPLASGLPISKRYPGLMRFIGQKGQYGKQAIPMFDHANNGHQPHVHVLDRILKHIGIEDDKQRQKHIWQLLQSSALPHIKGLTEVWSHLLSIQHPTEGRLQ